MKTRMIFFALLAIVAGLIEPVWAQQSSRKVQQLFDRVKMSAVKLRITGLDPHDVSKRREATAFFIYSDKGRSFLLTAAHVIGSNETEQSKNPDWKVENGVIKRKIRMETFDARGGVGRTSDEVEVAPSVLPGVDIALLMVEMDGFKVLPLAGQLVEKAAQLDVILLGVQEGQSSLTRPIPSGTGSLVRLKFATSVPSKPGESGGAWIDVESGRVFAVASATRASPNGPSYEATPVTLIKPTLSAYFKTAGLELDGPVQTAEVLRILDNYGFVSVAIGGDTGDLKHGAIKTAGLSELVNVEGRGAETSECDAGSGRTFSQALARALVSPFEKNGLRFEVRYAAQGGHYRRAVTCLGGKPIGLRGFDTSAEAKVDALGTIGFEQLGADPIAVSWTSMPKKGAEISVKDVQTGSVISTYKVSESGRLYLDTLQPGTYALTTKIEATTKNTGACCGVSDVLNATVSVVPAGIREAKTPPSPPR